MFKKLMKKISEISPEKAGVAVIALCVIGLLLSPDIVFKEHPAPAHARSDASPQDAGAVSDPPDSEYAELFEWQLHEHEEPTKFRFEWTQKLGDNEASNKNITRAADILNGTWVKAGDIFSFNDTVGERTLENGFVEGTIQFGGVEKKGIGGGICMVSTLLYQATMGAGWGTKTRHSHSRPVWYAERGLDAAVSWPDQDFRFLAPEKVLIESGVWEDELRVTFITDHFIDAEGVRDSHWFLRNSPEKNKIPVDHIESRWIKKSRIIQRGKPGISGFRTWQLRGLVVNTHYKPIREVWMVPTGGLPDAG